MFISNVNQIGKDVPNDIHMLANRFWPGPLTIIYKKQGYRMPKNNFLLKLINELGPLWSSSANISGQNVITDLLSVRDIFIDNIEDLIVIIDGTVPSGVPSTIYSYDEKKILREGSIKKDKLFS